MEKMCLRLDDYSCLTEENQVIYNEFEKVYGEYLSEIIKLKKLGTFLNTKKFNSIDENQKGLIVSQYRILRDYCETLKDRLKDFLEILFTNSI